MVVLAFDAPLSGPQYASACPTQLVTRLFVSQFVIQPSLSLSTLHCIDTRAEKLLLVIRDASEICGIYSPFKSYGHFLKDISPVTHCHSDQ